MPLYDLPKFELPKLKLSQFWQSRLFWLIVAFIFIALLGFLAGSGFKTNEPQFLEKEKIIEKPPVYLPQTSQEEAVIKTVKEASPSVVSIIITKDLPVVEQFFFSPFPEFFGPEFQIPQFRERGTQKQRVGGGSGFIVSPDGLILTNKHVVSDTAADYTVLTNDGKKYPAKVLAKDPLQDLAIIKIEQEKIVDGNGNLAKKSFPVVKLGDADKLETGQTVIAIGNALGEFQNTVSVGVVSGLGRTITAEGGGQVETLEDVIQTDAAINKGNSGGPLLNLKGEVIGINTAISQEGQNIGFAIPINRAKRDIQSIESSGKIIYPFLGVRYIILTEDLAKENNLSVSYGAWVQMGQGEPAVFPDSPAAKAGLKEGDIILEFNGEKITTENKLGKIILKYAPGDKVSLKVLRNSEEITLEAALTERAE